MQHSRRLPGRTSITRARLSLFKAVARWMMEEGLNIDSASEGELRTALAGGVPGHRIGLHGNNKSDAEVRLALECGIAHIVIDSLPEIEQVAHIARAVGVVAPVYVRLTTGVHAGGHHFIQTAHEDQKFGLSVNTGAAQEAIIRIARAPELALLGLHSHIGSQILSTDGFAEAAKAVLDVRAWAALQGIDIPQVDLGGGYGVRYTSADATPPAPAQFAQVLADAVRTRGNHRSAACAHLDRAWPFYCGSGDDDSLQRRHYQRYPD
ncbi:diaminopimelate decarboxylase family protein [Trueperella pyogenes]|uniref:diaminopimelate decarboxylase family protein n=1 Tax=Trueperella pyogenes TaxID=1661 RepID=UPI003DA96D4B